MPTCTIAGNLEVARATFGSSSNLFRDKELKWQTFRFELKGTTLFFTQADVAHSAANFRKLALVGVVAIKLDRAVGPGQFGETARRSMLTLSKPSHHVLIRVPIFSRKGPGLDEWHEAIASCLPDACRVSSAGGSAAVSSN